MKILWLSFYYLPHAGGGSWTTYNLSKYLATDNEVIIITPNIKNKMFIDDININKNNKSILERIPNFKIPNQLSIILGPIAILFSLIIKNNIYDIIIIQHHPHTLLSAIGIIYGKLYHIPVIVRADDVYRPLRISKTNNFVIQIISNIDETLFKYANRVLVVCSESKNLLKNRLFKKGILINIELSPNGYNENEFKKLISKNTARDILNISNDEMMILFTGRFSGKEYGIEILLRAFSLVINNNPMVNLYLVGDELNEEQKNIIKQLKLEKNVHPIGPQNRETILKFLISSDIFIGTCYSDTGTIQLKLLEYLRMGKPIITAKVSQDILKDHKNLYIIESNTLSIYNNINRIINDKKILSQKNKKSINNLLKYNWENIATDLAIILKVELKNE